ncbi:MAG: PEP/pyruvate-binding domain-containing protein [Thermomicrobiales bacterium]
MTTDILWLGQEACHDCALVGGKVANLSRLAAAYAVPSGFCVPTTALIAGVTDTGAAPSLALPPVLRETLAAAYRMLAELTEEPEPRVAVRSSAADEDGSAASFAGQHDTYLNIAGADAVMEAVARCWASAHTERAYDYRRQHGLPLDQIRLAVFVQHLIPADVAAVVFSANPVTGNRGEVLINASWGLGESIVGGTVTPDTYVVDKASGTTERRIAEKRRMTVAVPGGTREVDVPRFLRCAPALNTFHIAAMADLARALEATMGWPVDVECALHGEELYLLQCRPITTLMPHQPAAFSPTITGAGIAVVGR